MDDYKQTQPRTEPEHDEAVLVLGMVGVVEQNAVVVVASGGTFRERNAVCCLIRPVRVPGRSRIGFWP